VHARNTEHRVNPSVFQQLDQQLSAGQHAHNSKSAIVRCGFFNALPRVFWRILTNCAKKSILLAHIINMRQ
jgi:hypothetical protein